MELKKLEELFNELHRKPIANYLEKDFREEGVITGSTVFGGKLETETDVDIILPPNVKETWSDTIFSGLGFYVHSESDPYSTTDFKHCYVKTKSGIFLDLLFMENQRAYNKYVYATNKVKNEYKQNSSKLKNKVLRVSTFEYYKKQFEEG